MATVPSNQTPILGTLLSDLEILDRITRIDNDSCIFITPLIDPDVQLGPSSLDVRLSTKLEVPVTLDVTHIDLAVRRQADSVKARVERNFQSRAIEPEGRFVLHPGEFSLGSTLEFIRLPCDIAARLEGRSSIARLGLEVHSTAGFVDPGYEGELTFELKNVGRLPVVLRPGLRVAQLCFFRLSNVERPYNSKPHQKYGGSVGPRRSGIDKDPELSQ
ncbi:MAG: dCTP deaminase [Phycisphaerales bacterium]|nr:dCTP deaminase [Phycisphaerales bacterium]